MIRVLAVLAAGVLLAPHTTTKHAPAVTEVTVTATDFAYDAPATLPAGVIKFNLVNKGSTFHHLTIVRLDGGHTVQDLAKAMSPEGPPPPWFVVVGGPNAPAPGGTANATVALQPGNYVLMCFVSTPQDPQPHFMKGMMKPLTVTPSKAEKSSLGKADVTLSLLDYSFVTDKDITAGKHTVRVENNGPQDHEVEFIRLAPGKTVDDLMGWMQTMQGPPPGEPLGGVASLAKGQANLVDVDFTPGSYVLLCFVPDAKDGAPHFTHGMVRVIEVK